MFLRNHRDAIAAMDFFTVPTLTFGMLYCFFVIDHDRRKILHLNVTQNPSAPWVALQLRQTWAYDQPQRFLIFDRDAKFNADVVATVEDYGMRAHANRLAKSVAEWHRGALGGKPASRPTGPRDCSEPEAFEEVDEKITSATITKIGPTSDSVRTLPAVELRPLHPRSEARSFPAATRWVASPLRCSGLSQLLAKELDSPIDFQGHE